MIKSSPPYSLVIRGNRLKLWFIPFLCLALLNITACDYISSPSKTKSLGQPPFAQTKEAAMREARDNAQAAMASEGINVNPISGLKNENDMAGSLGLTTNRLFSTALSNPDDRFTRIENAVQKISDKIDDLSPSITRLVDIDSDMTDLMHQLEVLLNEKDMMETQPAIAEFQAIEKIPLPSSYDMPSYDAPPHNGARPNPDPTSTLVSIHAMRIADHKGKTRIVFESTQRLNYEVSIDNNNGLMRIHFINGQLGLDPAALARKSKLFNTISQNIENDGGTISFALSQQTQEVKRGRINPNKDSAHHRIFIDFSR